MPAAVEGPVFYRLNDDNTGPELLVEVFRERGWLPWEDYGDTGSGEDTRGVQCESSGAGGGAVWHVWWRHGFPANVYRKLKSFQLVSHIPRGNGLCRKDKLARTLQNMKRTFASAYDFFPTTFLLPCEYTKLVAEYTRLLYPAHSTAITSSSNNNNSHFHAATASNPKQFSTSVNFLLENSRQTKAKHQAPKKKISNLRKGFSLSLEEEIDGNNGVRQTNVWICKPIMSSQGRGITIFDDVHQLSYGDAAVVQRYICNPLLVGGYKCDLRLYILVTSLLPLTVYIYQEGLVRFGTEKYNLSSLDRPYSHLTNTSLNKGSPGYEEEKDRVGAGCKWSLRQLRHHLQCSGRQDWLLWQRVNALVSLTLLAHLTRLQSGPPASADAAAVAGGGRGGGAGDSCFELYGFDILVDESLTPWLLEVNRCPSLSHDCEVDRLIKKPMLHHLFDLLGPPCVAHPVERLLSLNGQCGDKKSKGWMSRSNSLGCEKETEAKERIADGNGTGACENVARERKRTGVCKRADGNAEAHASKNSLGEGILQTDLLGYVCCSNRKSRLRKCKRNSSIQSTDPFSNVCDDASSSKDSVLAEDIRFGKHEKRSLAVPSLQTKSASDGEVEICREITTGHCCKIDNTNKADCQAKCTDCQNNNNAADKFVLRRSKTKVLQRKSFATRKNNMQLRSRSTSSLASSLHLCSSTASLYSESAENKPQYPQCDSNSNCSCKDCARNSYSNAVTDTSNSCSETINAKHTTDFHCRDSEGKLGKCSLSVKSKIAEEVAPETFIPAAFNSTFQRLRQQLLFVNLRPTRSRASTWHSLHSNIPPHPRRDGRGGPNRCGGWVRTFPFNTPTLHATKEPQQIRVAVAEVHKYRRVCEKVASTSSHDKSYDYKRHIRDVGDNGSCIVVQEGRQANVRHHKDDVTKKDSSVSVAHRSVFSGNSNKAGEATPKNRTFAKNHDGSPRWSPSSSDAAMASHVQPLLWRDHCIWTPGL